MKDSNSAYDLSRFESRENESLRVIENKKVIQEKRRNTLVWFERILTAAVVLALVVSVLYSQTRLTALSDKIATMNSQLVEAKSQYDTLNYQLESGATLTRIEEYVSKQLGMVKTDKSQVEYVTMTEQNKVEKSENGFVKYWNNIQDKLNRLMEYLGG